MKHLYILFICASVTLQAQTVDTYSAPASMKKVLIDLQYADVNIHQSDTKEIKLTKQVNINEGMDNDKYKMVVKESSSELTIKGSLDHDDLEYMRVGCDKGNTMVIKKSKLEEMDEKDKKWNCYGTDSDVTIDLEIPSNIQVYVKTVYGDVEVKSLVDIKKIDATYGDILVERAGWNQDVKLKSTYGTVDVTMPQSLNADLRVSTSYGEIYTDMEFSEHRTEKFRSTPHGTNFSAKLNNGGPSIHVEATYDNIYLRKT